MGDYTAGGKLKIALWYFVNHIIFMSFFPFPDVLKVFLLSLFGAKVDMDML